MKKLISKLLLFPILLSFCACSKEKPEETGPVVPAQLVATEEDRAALDATYAGKTLRYGEMHNHTKSSVRADGQRTLQQWKDEMTRLKMDFAFILDHEQSQHMYHSDWDDSFFIGGTEPGTVITDSKARQKNLDYGLLFSDAAALESLIEKWSHKFKIYRSAEEHAKYTPHLPGIFFPSVNFTTEEFGQFAEDAYAAGGLLVHLHPRASHSYLMSDDPLDYYFADYTGMEITTGFNGNMMFPSNEEAYQIWDALLKAGKKVWATAGSDSHRLPDYSGLTAMYTTNDHKDDYMATVRAGNMAPGWIGIRMNINGTAMGGETDFTGQRLQFSVGDIYNPGVTHTYDRGELPYIKGHSYSVELYDETGLLMEAEIDPLSMNYFAFDCNADAKYYRVVVWDSSARIRIGVSNPIWNTAAG